MDKLTQQTMAMINAAIDARMPTMLVGAPGTGKTVTVKAIARERDYSIISLVGSRMDPTDVTGLPKGEFMGQDENQKDIFGTVNLSPWWQVEIIQKKKVILFLDEWGNSPGAVQAAFLTLLQDREFPNGHKFPDETIVIGAMNPPEEGADSYEMALPTTNRIFWINWSPTAPAWVEGMKTNWGQPASDEEMKWKHKIARFISDNPTYLHKTPDGNIGTGQAYAGLDTNDNSAMTVFQSAWPSRRSWDNLSRVLATAPDTIYVQDTIAQGIVGYSASNAFREFLRKFDVIDPKEVLKDPSSVDWNSISVDDANLLLRAITEMSDNHDTVSQAIEVFNAVAKAKKTSIGAPFMRDFINKATTREVTGSGTQRKEMMARVQSLIHAYQSVSSHSVS